MSSTRCSSLLSVTSFRHLFPSLFSVTFFALAHAGGSNYGIAPGALPEITGKIAEYPVPTPRFARDPAPAPDGSIFIAVMSGNKVGTWARTTGASA